jgi:hypothetical protein
MVVVMVLMVAMPMMVVVVKHGGLMVMMMIIIRGRERSHCIQTNSTITHTELQNNAIKHKKTFTSVNNKLRYKNDI